MESAIGRIDAEEGCDRGRFGELPILAVLLFGAALVVFLADPTLQSDPAQWMATARNLHQTGDPGFQHRNILFTYVLALPLALGIEPVKFGVAFSGVSFLLAALFLYRITTRYVARCVAATTSLLFVVSYSTLRYGTQVFTDVPTIACLMVMVFFHLRFLEHRRPQDLLIGYLALGAAVSLRYASAFVLLAHAWFAWTTRRAWRWHLAGIGVALIPYVPQFLFNLKYLHHPLAVSYAAKHPILDWRFFVLEMQHGIRFQLFHYLRYLFFDFRGLFVALTPLCALGAIHSFRATRRPVSLYLVLFAAGFIGLLAFYAFFSSRYSLPVLVPCFVWLAIGIERLGWLLRTRPRAWRIAFPLALGLIAYGMFEISFQLVQSSRALHVHRETVLRGLSAVVADGDVILVQPNLRATAVRLVEKDVEVVGLLDVTPETLAGYAGRSVYAVWTPKQWASEGGDARLSVGSVQDRLIPIRTTRSRAVVELILYRLLRLTGRQRLIPTEEWIVMKAS